MRAAIGCIFNRDGKPVDRRELELLAAHSRLPWGGRPQILGSGAFGLVWVPAFPVEGTLAATAASDHDAFGGGGRFSVAIDGTLDNRKELARELGLGADATAPGSEPYLIASACERWGTDCAARLIGEFALLAWDRREHQLLAVRDVFGVRELFFVERGDELRIASQCCMLIDRPTLSDIDEEYVADFLAAQQPWGKATPFRGIRRLLSGQQLVARRAGIEVRRFWEAARPWLQYRDAAEYGEHFRTLFVEAVQRSLATGGRVWSELSGGLDSSSIVCLAQEQIRSDSTTAKDFATITYVWDETPQCDERELSGTVVSKYNLVNHQIRCDDLFFDGAYEESLFRNEPHFGLFAHPMLRLIGELVRDSGVSVLLCGTRAEAVVLDPATPPVHLADLVRALRLQSFVRELFRWQRGTRKPLANLLLTYALGPLFGQGYRYSVSDRGTLQPWVSQGFAHRMQLRQRARSFLATGRFPGFAQKYQCEMMMRTEQMMTRGFMEWSCEIRHPFLYRPLVELALAIPWEQKIAPRESKLLLRRSLKGILPEEICTRRGGTGPGAAMYKAFAKRWHSIEPVVRSSLLVSMGYLDGAELRRAAELVRFGGIKGFASFLACLGFEYWLQATIADAGAGARPGRAPIEAGAG